MMSVSKSSLPVNKPKPLTLEEIERRRTVARQRHQERLDQTEEEASLQELSSNIANSLQINVTNGEVVMERTEADDDFDNSGNDEVFIAFARVYSGTLRKGAKIYVLTPKHDPRTLE